jgi:hypothetical protein
MYELGNELVSWNCIKIRERVDRVRVRESSKSVWVVRGCTIGREQGRVAGGGGRGCSTRGHGNEPLRRLLTSLLSRDVNATRGERNAPVTVNRSAI